ncbi:sep domain-containing protein [Ophiostoma piceae UAMH 11346]|uniref:Sep domain-containing protein n=1 Tax=Ophiostoma piceae (strain UAMH 11346) TaxID=1262450 RepID=S3C6R3_OPHP1|nr:sep domain-containing protein [Ophiostoma piceae UAMH 11346]
MAESQDEIISNFVAITGASTSEAQEQLDAADWDINTAVAEFLQSREDAADETAAAAAASSSTPAADPGYTGPRTLDGRPAPQSQASASSSSSPRPQQSASQQKRKGLMTFSSLKGGGSSSQPGGGHGHGHDDNDDDDDSDFGDDENPNRGDLFAGGEKSGLAVKDPNMAGHSSQKIMRDIVSKAKQNRSEPGPSSQAPSRFRGSGMTLGGEGTESRVIPDPAAPAAASRPGAAGGAVPGAAAAGEAVERSLHIWNDGFSIDDGPLHRYDDPSNAADLAHIRQGRAPLHLMNVAYDQPVDVKLIQHEEAWHQLPRIYRPFSGEGRRLGNPTAPGETAAFASASVAVSTPAAPAAAPASNEPTIDESQPTLMIRVQLPDGTRLPARFNTTQTIGDVYDFVQRALPAAQQTRGWVLATTFPNKDHTDKAVVLGETSEFKRGGAAVVKWT